MTYSTHHTKLGESFTYKIQTLAQVECPQIISSTYWQQHEIHQHVTTCKKIASIFVFHQLLYSHQEHPIFVTYKNFQKKNKEMITYLEINCNQDIKYRTSTLRCCRGTK